jgi:hypothetical protein
MKKSMILGILFLSSMILVSCGKSPQEKIVGEWGSSELPGVLTFNSDGTAINWERETGKWELSGDEEPFKLIVMYDGYSEVVNLIFISDDEIELEEDGRKRNLKRKG